MKRTVWYMYKLGEERDFVSTRPPETEWAKAMHLQGYILVSFEIDLPDPAHLQLGTLAALGPYRPSTMGPAHPARPMVHTVESLTVTLRETFVRAEGDCACPLCSRPYREHPADEAEEWLTVLCDGRRVKL